MADEDKLSREEMVAAMALGVRQAFDGALADLDLQAVIADGVEEAFNKLSSGAIREAIMDGVKAAFDQVYGSQILNAISDGTAEALSKK